MRHSGDVAVPNVIPIEIIAMRWCRALLLTQFDDGFEIAVQLFYRCIDVDGCEASAQMVKPIKGAFERPSTVLQFERFADCQVDHVCIRSSATRVFWNCFAYRLLGCSYEELYP